MTNNSTPDVSTTHSFRSWVYPLLLLYILAAGAFFRFNGSNAKIGTGLYWGEYQYLHPDERFLVWVGSDISPVHSLSEYFDTPNSSLNPNNRGHGFYVYGTFPMFITRYLVEGMFGHSGFDVMTQVGRLLSALMDLFTICLVYLVGERLYNRRVGILAAAFSAAAVLPIQQSHFFTMDTFTVALALLAFYFAVLVLMDTRKLPAQTATKETPVLEEADLPVAGLPDAGLTDASLPDTDLPDTDLPDAGTAFPEAAAEQDSVSRITKLLARFFRHPLFFPSLAFGVALGMAVASKLDAAPMAIALPAAMLLHLAMLPREERQEYAGWASAYLLLAAFVSLMVFRVFQPYAFSGPGFFGFKPNPQWVANIRELLAQGGKDVDFPPAMQWARRSKLFSFQNIVLWGLGLPLGILAWSGFVWMAWRMLRGWLSGAKDWLRHALMWSWMAMFFAYQSSRSNPTMRYELMIYPMLAIFAAWTIISLYDLKKSAQLKGETIEPAAPDDDSSTRVEVPAASAR